jgi:16S rRNA (guanine527-N7)-methyltransferase
VGDPADPGLDALHTRHGLTDFSTERLLALLRLVAGDPRAPTTVREPGRILDDHLADSLVALDVSATRRASTLADLGSGAGFPGLPLAIALPDAQARLIESSARKCEFIQRAILVTEARNAVVVNARVEAWKEGLAWADLVTARALAPLDVVAEYAAPLLRIGGTLLAWRGRRDAAAERAGSVAAEQLGLEVGDILPVEPYPGASHRHLHLFVKTSLTPQRFPRRPGVARKRPLGARTSI